MNDTLDLINQNISSNPNIKAVLLNLEQYHNINYNKSFLSVSKYAGYQFAVYNNVCLCPMGNSYFEQYTPVGTTRITDYSLAIKNALNKLDLRPKEKEAIILAWEW